MKSRTHLDDWASRGILAVAALLLGLLILPVAGAAQSTPPLDFSERCAPEIPEEAPRRAVIRHLTLQGIWFQADVARCMLGRLAAARELQGSLTLYEERLRLGDERYRLAADALKLSRQMETKLQASLKLAIRLKHRAEAERDAWYLSPVLWIVVGAAVASVPLMLIK